jgi:membrane associated rhomboid family serine protease
MVQLRSLQSESLLAESQSPRMSRYEPASAGNAAYQPPVLGNSDTLDDMVSKMSSKVGNLHDDKYRTIAPADSELVPASRNSYFRGGPGQSAAITESRTRGTIESQLTASTVTPTRNFSRIASGTIMPPAVRHVSEESQSNYVVPPAYTSGSLEPSTATVGDSAFYSESQAGSTRQQSEQSQSRFNSMSMSSRDSTERFLDPAETFAMSADEEDGSSVSKQTVAFSCIIVSALQLMVLLIQLILCGVASVDVNPMIGPFPDAFSEWGGKNAYLMLDGKQYWRIITPVLLHVGVLHLLTNVFCQLETCAFFEREWGSSRWITLYLISGVGSVGASCVFDPDVIGVNSSGALMGLMGAKLAQIIGWTMFDLHNNAYYDLARLDQLGGIMCSTALICILAFFTYIDFSGHIGGLAAGFLGGMFVFCKPIENICIRVLWGATGLFGLMAGAVWIGYTLLYETEPDPDLADACGYFRNLFPEGYDCECIWN